MKHLDVLQEAGLLTFQRQGQERWNFINAVRLKAALDRWIAPYQMLWANRLQYLASALEEDEKMSAPGSSFNGFSIRQEINIAAPANKLFDALTKHVNRWWDPKMRQTGSFGVLSLEEEIGAPLLEINPNGHAVVWARIEEIQRPNILYLSGRFGVKGALSGRIHYDIVDRGHGQSHLTLSHQAVGDISTESEKSFGEGWKLLLSVHLPHFLTSEE